MEVRKLVLSDVQLEIEKLARARMAERNLAYKEALHEVAREYPELFQAKNEMMGGRPGRQIFFMFDDHGKLVPALGSQSR